MDNRGLLNLIHRQYCFRIGGGGGRRYRSRGNLMGIGHTSAPAPLIRCLYRRTYRWTAPLRLPALLMGHSPNLVGSRGLSRDTFPCLAKIGCR